MWRDRVLAQCGKMMAGVVLRRVAGKGLRLLYSYLPHALSPFPGDIVLFAR